jgi:YaiO family outer membrane protein
MKNVIIIIIWCIYLGSPVLFGQEVTYAGDPDASFFKARELAFAGKHISAQDTLKRILTRYPDYTDVRSLLAKTYSWDAQYDEARKHLNRITSIERKNKEAWVAAIKNEIYAKDTYIALGLANKALQYLPRDQDILELRQQLWDDIKETGGVYRAADKNEGEEKEFKNQMALYNAFDVFDIVYEPMVYVGLEYTRNTQAGKIIPRVNYANRFDTHGLQYEVDLYPMISKRFYSYLNYGYSDSDIFPNHRVGAELYANLPKAKEASLGIRYLDFLNNQTTILTGSFGLYKGNYYFSLRPYVIPNQDGTTGVSGSLTARKYLKTKEDYFGFILNMGFIPELRQFTANNTLLAETLYFIDSQQLFMEYQFSGNKPSNLYKAQLGITHQELIFEPGRFFWAITAGLKYHIKF